MVPSRPLLETRLVELLFASSWSIPSLEFFYEASNGGTKRRVVEEAAAAVSIPLPMPVPPHSWTFYDFYERDI